MQPECHPDISNDITLDRKWVGEQIDRFIAWEIFCSIADYKNRYPLKNKDLCDRIGVNQQFCHHILYNVKNKLNAKRFNF